MFMKKIIKSDLMIPLFASIMVFLLTCWNLAISIYSALWAETVSYYVLTIYMLDKYAKRETYGFPVILMIMLGRVVLEIPVRMDDFLGTLSSLYVSVVVCISIILAAIYSHEKRNSIIVLSIIIFILLNSVGYDGWEHFIRHT